MSFLIIVGLLVISYFVGSIPFGLLVVRIFNGKDIRNIESGRIGGTNAMRAAGAGAGILTGLLDGIKGASTVWLARAVIPGNHWIEIFAALMAIMGHNFSVFLLEKRDGNPLKFRGGAGGATLVGGVFAFWPPSLMIILPIGFLIWYGIGYASLTTISAGILAMIIFVVKSLQNSTPWEYVVYSFLAELIVLWALRPNLARLRNGTERLQGWRAKIQVRGED